MKNDFFYCKSWFWAKKYPIEFWNKEQALEKHRHHATYTVLVQDPVKPHAVIDISIKNKFIGVTFLDKLLRGYLSYHFKKSEDETLFLSMVVYREYLGESDKVENASRYIFSKNHKVYIRRENFVSKQIEETEFFTDISNNYDQFPKFGDYTHLLKKERSLI